MARPAGVDVHLAGLTDDWGFVDRYAYRYLTDPGAGAVPAG